MSPLAQIGLGAVGAGIVAYVTLWLLSFIPIPPPRFYRQRDLIKGDVYMVDHTSDVRLIPLDRWERAFIRDIVKAQMTLAHVVPDENAVVTLRLNDLLHKVDPQYPPPVDEDGRKVVELNH